MISFVWAEDQKHQIGYKGHLPWRLPADLAHFKKVTMGHPMVMGKKTFDSFPGLLPGRQHVVLTHDTTLKEKYKDNSQVKILNSIDELTSWLDENQLQEISVIGGAMLFNLLLNKVDKLYKTEILSEFNGDTVMPTINYDEFKLISKKIGKVDEKNKYPYVFLEYERK
ncbi:dihydrofolate reductase [Lactobacillus salivarius]|uniref:Dihydrofolate reductase n=1 Tax=Ligilactobacillus salivarius TaxID=1624 RepID=A0A6N9IPU3_9LACO|nr:dihydrofolate reductase [Ligilactobacillus salivarius]MYY64205.1 dihydrofolate reductase [Ligilactobacillus salivarius]